MMRCTDACAGGESCGRRPTPLEHPTKSLFRWPGPQGIQDKEVQLWTLPSGDLCFSILHSILPTMDDLGGYLFLDSVLPKSQSEDLRLESRSSVFVRACVY